MEPAGAEQHRRKPARVSFREKVNQSNQPVEHKPCRPPNPSVVSRRGRGIEPRIDSQSRIYHVFVGKNTNQNVIDTGECSDYVLIHAKPDQRFSRS